MARGAVVAVSVHAGWIGRKCRLARLTIASGFGDGIDGSYRTFHRLVFLNRLRDALSCRSNSRRETPTVVREFLEKGRDLTERIPYSVIALAARFAVADVFWRSSQTKVAGFSIREESFYLFRKEYKVPLLAPDLAAYLSTAGERVFPILLFLGLASRLSTLGLFWDDYGYPVVCCPRRLT